MRLILKLPSCECVGRVPTDPFTILEPRDQEIAEFYVARECLATDFKAPKLRKGRSECCPELVGAREMIEN